MNERMAAAWLTWTEARVDELLPLLERLAAALERIADAAEQSNGGEQPPPPVRLFDSDRDA